MQETNEEENPKENTPWIVQQVNIVYSDKDDRYLFYIRACILGALIIGSTALAHWIFGVIVAVYGLYIERSFLSQGFMQRQIQFIIRNLGMTIDNNRTQGEINVEVEQQLQKLSKAVTNLILKDDEEMQTPKELKGS